MHFDRAAKHEIFADRRDQIRQRGRYGLVARLVGREIDDRSARGLLGRHVLVGRQGVGAHDGVGDVEHGGLECRVVLDEISDA